MALSDTGLLVRYYIDEVASGDGDGTVDDYSGNAYHLTITDTPGNLAYTEVSGQRGLESISTTGDQRAVKTIATSDLLMTSLNGVKTATVEVVVDLDTISASNGRVFAINDTVGGNPRFGLYGNSTTAMWAPFNGNNSETFDLGTTKCVVHLVYDTTQATQADRIKVYKDGTLLSSPGNANFGLDATLSISVDQQLIMFNRANGSSYDRSFDGILFYAAIYNVAFSSTRCSDHYDVLVADDDSPAVLVVQEGFRFATDSAEGSPSWLAAQDANLTKLADETAILALAIDTTGDPGAKTYKLQYREVGAGTWLDVPVA